MGTPGRPLPQLKLSEEDRAELGRLSRRSRVNRNLAFRARIVLLCADGLKNSAVADELRTTNQTVGKWRQRFVDAGLNALYDEPRVGAPRSIRDDEVEAVVVKTL